MFWGIALKSMAQVPTFSENIASIFYNNCTTCHRTGGIGPFALEGYGDVVNNALAIKTAVVSGAMPPWPPDTTYWRGFPHERVLTQLQISQIVNWVDGNMPQGNPANEPPVPVFSSSSQLSQTPSATYRIPTYTITSNQDDYQFVIPNLSGMTQAVTEVEFIPANKSIVHHILVYYDTSGICQQLDDADPLPGYQAFGGIGNSNAKQIAGWVPGSPPSGCPQILECLPTTTGSM